ncbi:hypothetical protein UCDDS831_g03863 [Diplodia seriata]|uniref:Uncharacterized protein n=1 Tax=Diplodia seriata TaxID=420778 RepID=A0A0G2EGP2_9PEZI|nr:hypothetical protein UCDDS831_g03863 [Diplodia seriata]
MRSSLMDDPPESPNAVPTEELVRTLSGKWGDDKLKWLPPSSHHYVLDIEDWPCRLLKAMHALAERTHTFADRDYVMDRLHLTIFKFYDSETFKPRPARSKEFLADQLAWDAEKLLGKLQPALRLVDDIVRLCGEDVTSHLPLNHTAHHSALEWGVKFLDVTEEALKEWGEDVRAWFTSDAITHPDTALQTAEKLRDAMNEVVKKWGEDVRPWFKPDSTTHPSIAVETAEKLRDAMNKFAAENTKPKATMKRLVNGAMKKRAPNEATESSRVTLEGFRAAESEYKRHCLHSKKQPQNNVKAHTTGKQQPMKKATGPADNSKEKRARPSSSQVAYEASNKRKGFSGGKAAHETSNKRKVSSGREAAHEAKHKRTGSLHGEAPHEAKSDKALESPAGGQLGFGSASHAARQRLVHAHKRGT